MSLQNLKLVAGPLLAIVFFFLAGLLPFEPDTNTLPPQLAAAITAWVASYWLTGAIPLGAASLLPLVLMPIMGVLPFAKVAPSYAHPVIWLFFGGFILALGVERWRLHNVLALGIIKRAGPNPYRLIFGFMLAAAGLSMFISNTATALLLLPIATATVASLVKDGLIPDKHKEPVLITLLLGIAYACSIGGIGTPIGTPPNALFLANYQGFVDKGAPPISFGTWMSLGLPLVAIFLPLVFLFLILILRHQIGKSSSKKAGELHIEKQKLTGSQLRMLLLFGLAALLWLTRRDVTFTETFTLPGWWRLLPIKAAGAVGDGTVAVGVALLTFIIPSGDEPDKKPGTKLMDWAHAQKLPWDILLLFGGGIAIAKSFEATGLAHAVGVSMQSTMSALPPILMIASIGFLTTFLTEVTSNTAMTALLLPILASAAPAANIDPRLPMLAATFSASCAFMLPIATPPNAIVFSTGTFSMKQMAKIGFGINLLGVLVITLVVWFWAVPLLGIQIDTLPDWAMQQP
ncbi:SLC13/DASS family transporter [Myxococcota bacterium]|nr:SLC13/DASS family transporter [Myxococcota bacterium]